MKLKVLYFASIREKVGTSAEELELPSGVSTVGELKGHIGRRGGAWTEAFQGKALLRSAVNQDMVQDGATIKAGDEVAFFPPVTGG